MLSKVNLKKLKNAHVSKPTDTRQQQKANEREQQIFRSSKTDTWLVTDSKAEKAEM